MVTIIMPAYNAEKHIVEAIDSVLAQTYTDWELLVLDDCSTDHTAVVVEDYTRRDKRVHLLRNKVNLGVGQTRNCGVDNSTAEWIAFLDSDDMWEPDKLKKQMALVEDDPKAELIFTASSFIDESGEKRNYILHVPQRITRKELLKQNLISCSSVLVKRALLLEHKMPGKGMIHEDFATWLSILDEKAFAYGIDEPLLIYRLSANSKSGNKIKAAKMNWNTYRASGLKPIPAIYYMICYMYNGVKKYRNIKNKQTHS